MDWDTAIGRLEVSEGARDAVGRLTYREALEQLRDGRLAQQDWDAFETVWTWTAPRYTGIAGVAQERYYQEHGPGAYTDLLNGRRDAVERILGHDVP